MSDLYSLAGLDGPGGKPAAVEPSTAVAQQPASSEPVKKVLGSAPWSALSDQSKRFAPPVLKRPAPGANKPKAASLSVGAGAAACSSACTGSVSAPTSSTSWYKDVKTPYDPAHPNDYDDWLREQEIMAKQRRLDEDLQRKLAERQQEDDEARRRRAAGPPPPPPPRQQLAPPPPPPPRQPAAAPPPPLPEGFSAAGETGEPGITMLQKMGWSEGQGLGKEGQGMKTPLVAKKMDSTTGVITNAEHRPLSRPPPPPPPPPPSAAAGVAPEAKKTGAVTFRGRPSRVLLMKNMVGPGEVDEDLVNEIGEECSKYGEVAKVSIFEVKEAADEEAVRIFVKFQKQAAAMKAYIEMDKRFFGGRQVWVCFFQEKDFDAGTLGPSPIEPR